MSGGKLICFDPGVKNSKTEYAVFLQYHNIKENKHFKKLGRLANVRSKSCHVSFAKN
jgi:hypothetical protein